MIEGPSVEDYPITKAVTLWAKRKEEAIDMTFVCNNMQCYCVCIIVVHYFITEHNKVVVQHVS